MNINTTTTTTNYNDNKRYYYNDITTITKIYSNTDNNSMQSSVSLQKIHIRKY